MSRKMDLEQHIRESYGLVREYKSILQTASDPREKIRCRRAIEEQWRLIEGHLDEYVLLHQRLGEAIASDMVQIATHFPKYATLCSQRQPGVPAHTTAPVPDVPSYGRQRLSQRRQELQSRWADLTARIAAVQRDLGLEMDGERKYTLQRRLADLQAEREQIEADLNALEQRQ